MFGGRTIAEAGRGLSLNCEKDEEVLEEAVAARDAGVEEEGGEDMADVMEDAKVAAVDVIVWGADAAVCAETEGGAEKDEAVRDAEVNVAETVAELCDPGRRLLELNMGTLLIGILGGVPMKSLARPSCSLLVFPPNHCVSPESRSPTEDPLEEVRWKKPGASN